MFDFLPPELKKILVFDINNIFELRIRANKAVTASYCGVYKRLQYCGNYLIYSNEDIKDMVFKACENSIYAYNDFIKEGYITDRYGVRIGLCGRVVYDNGKVITINDFSGLCVRIPHEIIGCAESVFYKITTKNGETYPSYSVKSTLVISQPGVGKTTFLRDIARVISLKTGKNVLVIDEKNELYLKNFDLGETTDVLSGCNKRFGFYTAIKTLCPDVIIADELVCESDVDGALFAKLSGVAVIASVHGKSYNEIVKKEYMSKAIKNSCFDIYITLKRQNGKVFIDDIKEVGGNAV